MAIFHLSKHIMLWDTLCISSYMSKESAVLDMFSRVAGNGPLSMSEVENLVDSNLCYACMYASEVCEKAAKGGEEPPVKPLEGFREEICAFCPLEFSHAQSVEGVRAEDATECLGGLYAAWYRANRLSLAAMDLYNMGNGLELFQQAYKNASLREKARELDYVSRDFAGKIMALHPREGVEYD